MRRVARRTAHKMAHAENTKLRVVTTLWLCCAIRWSAWICGGIFHLDLIYVHLTPVTWHPCALYLPIDSDNLYDINVARFAISRGVEHTLSYTLKPWPKRDQAEKRHHFSVHSMLPPVSLVQCTLAWRALSTFNRNHAVRTHKRMQPMLEQIDSPRTRRAHKNSATMAHVLLAHGIE